MQVLKKAKKKIFVIMPFVRTRLRTKAQLDNFFNLTLKKTIEQRKFQSTKFEVIRSNTDFNMLDSMILNIQKCDYIICDISDANPNVMFELGVRLTISNRPVILIQENQITTKKIFDISGFYTFDFNPNNYRKLTNYLVSTLRNYEYKNEYYHSPVLSIYQLHKIDINDVQYYNEFKVLEGNWQYNVANSKKKFMLQGFVEFEIMGNQLRAFGIRRKIKTKSSKQLKPIKQQWTSNWIKMIGENTLYMEYEFRTDDKNQGPAYVKLDLDLALIEKDEIIHGTWTPIKYMNETLNVTLKKVPARITRFWRNIRKDERYYLDKNYY